MKTRKKVHGHSTGKFAPAKNHCFACGKDNPDGMHLKFEIDGGKQQAICNVRIPKRFQGPPGHAHGGIIATILDEAMGKVNKFRNVVALTKSMTVEYKRPVPLEKPVVVVGFEDHVDGRAHHNVAEIRDPDGNVLARSEGLFIAVDAAKMFAKHIER